jgi:hypothetical protein
MKSSLMKLNHVSTFSGQGQTKILSFHPLLIVLTCRCYMQSVIFIQTCVLDKVVFNILFFVSS